MDEYATCCRCCVQRPLTELEALNGPGGERSVCRDFELCQRLAKSIEEHAPKADIIQLAEYRSEKDGA